MSEAQGEDSASICLFVLSGIPGSGKTSLMRNLIEQSRLTVMTGGVKKVNCPYFVPIEYDELLPPDVEKHILTVQQEEDREVSHWKYYRLGILNCVDCLIRATKEKRGERNETVSLSNILETVPRPEQVRRELWDRFVVMVHRNTWNVAADDIICLVIDDNMYYRSMRYVYYQLARKHTIGFCQCCLVIPTKMALKRNSERQAAVGDNVITSMSEKLEIPDHRIHKWETFSVVFSDAPPVDLLHEIISLIERASENPVQMLEEEEVDTESRSLSREICSTSVYHQADQILRRIVSKEMSAAKEKRTSAAEMKDMATELQEKRKKLLQALKSGKELVPSDLNIGKDDSKDSECRLFEYVQKLFYGYEVT